MGVNVTREAARSSLQASANSIFFLKKLYSSRRTKLQTDSFSSEETHTVIIEMLKPRFGSAMQEQY